MADGQHIDEIFDNSICNDIRITGDHQFAGSNYTPGPTRQGMGAQHFRLMAYDTANHCRSASVSGCNVRMDFRHIF